MAPPRKNPQTATIEAERLKKWRTFRGITQLVLAETSRLSLSAISRIESGDAFYSRESLEAVAKGLRVPRGALVDSEILIAPLLGIAMSGFAVGQETLISEAEAPLITVSPHPTEEITAAFASESGTLLCADCEPGTFVPQREYVVLRLGTLRTQRQRAQELALRQFTIDGPQSSGGDRLHETKTELAKAEADFDAETSLHPERKLDLAHPLGIKIRVLRQWLARHEEGSKVGWLVDDQGDYVPADGADISRIWLVVGRQQHYTNLSPGRFAFEGGEARFDIKRNT
jgi:transcriptional regulator with XRE-family HTH domain